MITKDKETSGVQAVEEEAGSSLSSRSRCSLEAMGSRVPMIIQLEIRAISSSS